MSLQKKLILIGILSYALISANIGGYSIYILDEAKNAECAREMLTTGNLIVPVFNGDLRTDKPPLHYFFMILSYLLFGVTPFAARLFSAFSGMGTVVLTFIVCRHYLSERTANVSVLVLLSSFGFITQFHLATPDAYLIFLITAALFSYFHFDQTKKTLYLYLAYLAIGLGVLAKGPVAIAIPCITVVFYLIAKRNLNWGHIWQLRPITGLLLILLIAAPWYLLVHAKTEGAWTQGFFLDHNIARFAKPLEGHGGSFLLPFLFFIGLLLPFSVFVPQIILNAWKQRNTDIILFCGIAAVSVLAFFTLSGTKLPNYVSPAIPFAGILAGTFLQDLHGMKKSGLIVSMLLTLVIGIAGFWGAWFFINTTHVLEELGYLAWFFIALPLAGVLGLVFSLINRRQKAIYMVSFLYIIFHQCFFYFIYPRIDARNPVAQTLPLLEDTPQVVYYNNFNPAFLFVRQQTIPQANTPDKVRALTDLHEELLIITHPRFKDELTPLDELEVVTQKEDLFDVNDVLIFRYEDPGVLIP